MVGKSENIYTDFDYNNITIVDPNKVVDEFGNVKERFLNQEDLVMYVNLECNMIPRTRLALGTSNEDSSIRTTTLASINFLKPGNKEYMDNSYTDELTGKDTLKGTGNNQQKKEDKSSSKQRTFSNGKEGSVDNGLLGITNITVSNDTSFMTQISMRLVDVKGRALFESGPNSPYAAFFTMPYPKFFLTIKGFLGKAIRLELMLQTFSTTYDSYTGNFDIQLSFFSYKFTVLAEINMGHLLATPHMYKSQVQVATTEGGPSGTNVPVNQSYVELGYQKIKELYSEYKSKGLIPDDFPEITVLQLHDRLDNFIKNILNSFTEQDLVPLSNIESYIKTVNEYYGEVFSYNQTSWFNTFIDTKRPYVLKNAYKTKVYTFKSELNNDAKTSAIAKLKGYISKYNGILLSNDTLGENGKYFISGKEKKSSIPIDISYENNFIYELGSVDDIDFKQTFKILSGNTEPTQEQLNELRNNFIKTNQLGNTQIINSDGVKTETTKLFQFENNSSEIANKVKSFNNPSFAGKIENILKEVEKRKQQIQDDLASALSDLLQSSQNGIGFIPNIRNVLAVFFANAEAFLRLLDDVHIEAWNQRDNPVRKLNIFNKEVADACVDNINSGFDKNSAVYPWPQFLVKTNGEDGHELFELKYPGDPDLISKTEGFRYDIWPEVEFVEEFIKGYIERDSRPIPPTPKSNELLQTNRISLNAIEFPVSNVIYFNKEEVKYLFEIYERISFVSNYSKLSRFNSSINDSDKITNLIAEGEDFNIVDSLGDGNPFLTKKLKEYGFNSSNFLTSLRHFSNDGTGQSWQNYLRGIPNTSYIKNLIQNSQFEFIDPNVLSSTNSQPETSLTDENSLVEFITNSTKSNNFDFTDIYPFIDDEWCKTGLANGKDNLDAKNTFDTKNVLKYNKLQKIISNFDINTTSDEIKPFSSFVFKKSEIPGVNNIDTPYLNLSDLKSFYNSRGILNQLVTEGSLEYSNYSGNVGGVQSTSIFNTPFFINSISEGVQKFRDFDKNPYIVPSYLFLNSLPLATLREKYKNYESETSSSTDLNYIFATIKKFGAIHKVPYPWILKYGSIWYRYKKWIETGIDILDNSWTDFDYSLNFDPITQDISRMYPLIVSGTPIDIVLQKDTVIGTETSTMINLGFYPKLINDFNVFYQGYMPFSGYSDNDIQEGINDGINVRYIDDSFINLSEGFDSTNPMRDLRVIPWSVDVNATDGVSTFLFPSHGSIINQTKDECFKDGKIIQEVNNNKSMYNGSVRLFWAAPQYGYFDVSKLTKPTPEEYLKKIFVENNQQENFSLNGLSGYTKISEIFSVFEKEVLDLFENEFLNFSKARYDFVESGLIIEPTMSQMLVDMASTATGKAQTESGDGQINTKYKNFHLLMIEMMKVPISKLTTGEEVIKEYQKLQTENITNLINSFLNYEVAFKNGNPSNYDRRVFGSFTSVKIENPITWDTYKLTTPNSLPNGPGTISLSQSKLDYPDAWKALQLYVGFSEINNLVYSDSGSYITDFFIDFDVAFTENNIKNLSKIIKLYTSQKLSQYQNNPTPPSLPSIPNSNGTILETVTFSGGIKVIVFKDNDKKFAVLIDGNNETEYVGTKVLITENPSNDTIINTALITVFGSLIQSPAVISRVVEPIPQYPSSPNSQGKWSLLTFTNSIDKYVKDTEDFQNKITDNLFQKLRKNLKSVTIQEQPIDQTAMEGNQSKIELWESFKVLNDKWISGNDFKNKTLFEDVLLLDRASRNIGDKILVDIYQLKKTTTEINPTNSMLGFIQGILLHNHFVTSFVPGYVNFYNVQDATKNPKPKLDSISDFANNMFGTFLNVDYRNSSTKMVNFYAGKPSEYLDIKDNADYLMDDDAFSVTKSANNPLSESQINKNDYDKSNKVAGFNVDIGLQNQSIFYGFNVNQSNAQSTAEAIEAINQMANQTNGKQAQTQNISLYNLYKSRSYTSTLVMLGNAMIQPTMYFNLRHVPMFYGPYLITKVTHTITPGNFETVVTGVRQAIASLPKITDYIQKLKTSLLNSVLEESKRQKEQIESEQKKAENVKTQQQSTNVAATSNPSNTTSANQSCTATTTYQTLKYFVGDTTKVTKSFKEIKDIVTNVANEITNYADDNSKESMKLILFCSSYITTGINNGFQTNNNNFIGLTLDQDWGDNFRFQKNYFCSSNNTPFASFNTPEDSFRFLRDRWLSFANIYKWKTAEEITRHWIIYFASDTKNRELVYNQFDPTQLSNIESEVKQAINFYNSTN
jgi:hypothetical protein